MFIGNRKTKHSIRAYRAPGDAVAIPADAILHDVRTSTVPGYPFPAGITDAARMNPSLHIFEYRAETLYMHFVHRLMEATSEIPPK